MPAAMPLPIALGSIVDGRYRLLSVLGEGAMGAVYLAERGADERVAIKVLTLDHKEPAVVGRFTREARLASMIKHPNVLPVVDSGVDRASGRCFLVMPVIKGEDLGALLRRIKPLPPGLAVRIVLQAAEGLAVAHEAGVVHRDVKPSNLLLSREGSVVTTLVSDFGIARDEAAEQQLTATGASMGSPLYMAPEQFINAKGVDARADVWSLAVTLYEALCGKPPYGGAASITEVLIKVTTEEIPPIQELAPWLAPELALVVHAALLRPLEARCPSVRDFAAALLPFACPEPLELSAFVPLAAELAARRASRALAPTSWTSDVAPVLSLKSAAHDPMLGTLLGGKFRLLRKLGEGGMGAVYEAEAPDGARAALKVISRSGAVENPETVRRFMREAKSTRAVASEHVVRVLEAEQDGGEGVPFIAMELLHGLDVDTLVKRVGALEPRAAAQIFVQAARGLAAAHEVGIVHRDVKPANLFLHEDDEGRITTKVCDFGVAKSVQVSDSQDTTMDLTRTGGMLGSPLYMSPEQARNAKQVDARTDIWSLSISLYEALSGRKPWGGCTTMGELILGICTGELLPIQELAPWVSPELADVVHRGLQRDPAARWASLTEMAAALEPLSAEPGVTRRDLASLTAEQREQVAPRSTQAIASSATGAPLSAPSSPAAAPSRAGMIAVGALALLVAVGGTAALTRGQGEPPLPPSAEASSSPSAPAPAPRSVKLRVSPPDAHVTVGGAPRPLDADGMLSLQGEGGDTFQVVASANGSETSVKVFITREGLPTPDFIRVPASAPSGASGASAPSGAPAPSGPPGPPAGKPPAPLVARANVTAGKPPLHKEPAVDTPPEPKKPPPPAGPKMKGDL
jgi:serine/threonine protein kinase